MSQSLEETIRCGNCGHKQKFTCWSSVNVSLDPPLKKELIEGRLTTFVCEEYSESYQVAYDLLYHDMNRPLLVWLKYPHEKGQISIEEPDLKMFDLFGEEYTFRLVSSFQELIEKIRIFDNGFYDLTIELFKLIICMREGINIGQPLYYDRTEKSLYMGKHIVFVLPLQDRLSELRYSVSKQLSTLEVIQKKLSVSMGTLAKKWIYLNREYVLELLQESGMMTAIG